MRVRTLAKGAAALANPARQYRAAAAAAPEVAEIDAEIRAARRRRSAAIRRRRASWRAAFAALCIESAY